MDFDDIETLSIQKMFMIHFNRVCFDPLLECFQNYSKLKLRLYKAHIVHGNGKSM